ncbi:MAG: TIGR03435 family protein [Acidobacteriota bacterium]
MPGWAETDRYDIQAPLPEGGSPTDLQLRTMMQNLIKSRFSLAFHMEKRELSVYAIGLGKAGPAGVKMVKNDSKGTLPGFGSQGLGRMRARNATMTDFAGLLQFRVLDRPVIDQSGLTDRYDFTLDWTPDEFQFPGAPRGAARGGSEGSGGAAGFVDRCPGTVGDEVGVNEGSRRRDGGR